MVLAMAFALLLMYGASMIDLRNAVITPSLVDSRLTYMAVLTNVCFLVFMSVGASLIFVNMKNRQRCTAFIMLPASSAEKYVARWLYVTVGFALMFFVASVIADVLRWLFCLIIEPRLCGSVVAKGLSFFTSELTLPWRRAGEMGLSLSAVTVRMLFLLMLMVFLHSFYILGGSLFRRNCWLLTTCAGVALLLAVTLTGVIPQKVVTTDGMIPAATGVLACLSALCYAGSWWLFRRMEVINNKWMNV